MNRARGRRGSAPVPALRLEVWASPMAAAVADHFVVDTGCDFDLIVADPLREELLEGGVRPSRSPIRWGRPLLAERYRVEALCGGRGRSAEAYHPLGPTVDENLVGFPRVGAGDGLPAAGGAGHVARPREPVMDGGATQ